MIHAARYRHRVLPYGLAGVSVRTRIYMDFRFFRLASEAQTPPYPLP